MAGEAQNFVFVFPMFSGHINPSLPIARSLVKLGHAVHYVCAEQMREAIEGTGAKFHAEGDVEPELYAGRPTDLMGLMAELQKEHGLEKNSLLLSASFLMKEIVLERRLPGLIRFLQATKPAAVLYCPLSSAEAAWAARSQGIPHVGLNTIAGPGALTLALEQFAAQLTLTTEDIDRMMYDFEPNLQAHKRLQLKYGFGLEGDGGMDKPLGRMPHAAHAAFTMVTTTEDLYDPISPELLEAYESEGAKFVAVGPLLDEAGAKRAAGHRCKQEQQDDDHDDATATEPEILEKVASARKSGRAVVLASMGTVITGDLEGVGWEGRRPGADGQPRGLTGRELCRGAWSGVFEAFGAEKAEDGPLIVLALGPQPGALGELLPPQNAICAPVIPQVDVLKAGVDVFLTHGGQNSFTEALAAATPLVVCPGFGDQPLNAQKAVDVGVGMKVDRPDPDAGHEAEAVTAYRTEVATALRAVFAGRGFKTAAERCAENLRRAGGVPRAVELVLAASQGKEASDLTRLARAGA